MDIEILKFFANPEYEAKFIFRELDMKFDKLAFIALTFCIIPSKKFLYEIMDEKVHDVLQYDLINWWNDGYYRFCNDLYICKLNDDTEDTLFASASIAMFGYQDTKFLKTLCDDERQKNFNESEMVLDAVRRIEKMFDDLKLVNKYKPRSIFSTDPRYFPDMKAFILSNALRRPIIIFKYVEKDKHFINVYLPLHHDPAKCCKQPLVLAFYEDKYYPMLQMEDTPSLSYPQNKDAVPLEMEQGDFRAVHYLKDRNSENEMMEKYMDIVKIQNPRTIGQKRWTYQNLHGNGPFEYYCARIEKNTQNRPFYYKDFKDYYMREHPNSSK